MNRLAIKQKKLTCILLRITLIACCFLPLTSKATPQEAIAEEVASCHFFDTIEASSGYGKKFNWQSIAKEAAFQKAEELGASHLVWDRFNPIGAFNGVAIARLYKCNT